MEKITLYHNPRCSKSRNTLYLLEEDGKEVDIIEYLDTPPSFETIDEILNILDMEPKELMRKDEDIYKELNLDKIEDRSKLIVAMAENPILIQRPIVILGKQGVIGRPVENVSNFLKTLKGE